MDFFFWKCATILCLSATFADCPSILSTFMPPLHTHTLCNGSFSRIQVNQLLSKRSGDSSQNFWNDVHFQFGLLKLTN